MLFFQTRVDVQSNRDPRSSGASSSTSCGQRVWMLPLSKAAGVAASGLSRVTRRPPFSQDAVRAASIRRGLWPGGTVISWDINHRWRADRRGKSFPAHRRGVFYVSVSTFPPAASWRAWIEREEKNRQIQTKQGQTRDSSDKLPFLN